VSPLRGIVRDLVDRRLWPVAALLIVGLVAVPVLVLRPAPAALDSSTTTASAPAAAAPATAATATPAAATPGTGDATTDPSVSLTTSPFAAAFSGGLNLPPSMEGLLKSTSGADQRGVVAGAPLHDPFAGALTANTTTAPADASTAAAPAGDSSASSSAATPRSAPAASAPATPAAPASPAAPAADSTPTETAPASTPDATPAGSSDSGASTPSSDAGASAASTRTIYKADISFGTTSSNPIVSNAVRLTAFPTSLDPVAVFLGVMRGGWGAAFALRDGAQPIGSPSCRPRKQICTWVILHPGESVALNVKDATTGATTAYTLKLAKIRVTKVTPTAAATAAGRASTAGRCLLGPLAAYRYDTESGTLAPRPELKSCRYSTPGQASTSSVRVAHIG
jgi:hypothetical protein